MAPEKHKQTHDGIHHLFPGNFYATTEDITIHTTLGSCISVTLWDPVKQQGGMNHFMLVGQIEGSIAESTNARYGMAAMEMLINKLIKMGSKKKDLRAKLFGGCACLEAFSKSTISVNNIRFAFRYLDIEKIPIDAIDVGGQQGRKILFSPKTGNVKMKKVLMVRHRKILQKELDLENKIKNAPLNKDEYKLF